jgi:hypothetical protein
MLASMGLSSMLYALQAYIAVHPVLLAVRVGSKFFSFHYQKQLNKQGSVLASVAPLRVLPLIILKPS